MALPFARAKYFFCRWFAWAKATLKLAPVAPPEYNYIQNTILTTIQYWCHYQSLCWWKWNINIEYINMEYINTAHFSHMDKHLTKHIQPIHNPITSTHLISKVWLRSETSNKVHFSISSPRCLAFRGWFGGFGWRLGASGRLTLITWHVANEHMTC